MESQITKLTSDTIKVLILSDSIATVKAVVSVLTKAQIQFNWQQVATKDCYYDLLAARFDLILYDARLTQINLSEAVSCVFDNNLEIPLIVINGESHIPSAVTAIKAGAIDYIASNELAQLPKAIAKAITEPASCLQTNCSTQSERQLQKLITENADGIIVVNKKGIVQFVNPAALELLGKSREDLIGKLLGFPVVNGDYLEVDLPRRSGQIVAQMRVSQIQWLRENAYIVSLRDITHLKHAEAERVILLEEAQAANRAKDEFLAVLSHELRTPLNPILGWSQLLLNGHLPESQIAKAAEIINRNAQLQTQLIEDILDISRIIRGKLKLQVIPVNLITVIYNALDTVRFTAQAKSIEIETDLEENLGSVRGDSRRLQQIVGNLLSNAIKFTPSGGKVTVSLTCVNRQIQQSNHLEIVNQPVPHARLQVKDTGKGITPEFLPNVFDYFRQAESAKDRAEGGLGLGLAIVRRLVELHAGEIQATSPGLGKGATFTVFLPLQDTTKKLTSKKSFSRFNNLAEVKILIVDDDDASRDLLDFLLQDEGAEVLATKSAPQALAVFEQFQPDILISDIGMPSMSGYDLIKEIKEIPVTKGIKAIAVSGYVGDSDRQQSLAAGFDLHLNKPLDVNNLIEVVAQLVNS